MTLGNGIILVGEKDTCTCLYYDPRASQVALVVKNPPASAGDIRDTGQSLGQEDTLEEGIATHSSILTWRIPP